MKSHTCEFAPRDLLRLVVLLFVPLVLFAAVMQPGSRLSILPTPRPTLDAERTILIHQAEASREKHDAKILLLGDSSCLMNLSARLLSERIGKPALSLATFSFLDLNAHASFLREFTNANPNQLRAVIILMHPESLRRLSSEPYYQAVLTNYWSELDHCQTDTPAGRLWFVLGVDAFKGRLLSRALPIPLRGEYAHRYGFTRNLEHHLIREQGSAIDPGEVPIVGNSEFRLASTIERASKSFRASVPAGVKLLAGITPIPKRLAGLNYPERRADMLQQWAEWLGADVALTNLPAVLPDDAFARSTHLKEAMIPRYTGQLAAELAPHLN